MATQLQPRLNRSGYLAEDTIAALSTAPGGAIGVVRLSGPSVPNLFERLTLGRLKWSETAAGHARVSKVFDGAGRQLDEVLLLKFEQPHSFSGENLLEIQHHGNFVISECILKAVIELGARQALPGEFSFRAVRNGKMSLSQAEALADLISAGNEEAAQLALEKMSGSQQQAIVSVAEELRQLATMGELGIDFSDQDIAELGLKENQRKLDAVISKLRILSESFYRGSLLQEGVKTALVGLPNAGKSSFFNSLLGEDRSIVSHLPGTTRDVVREKLILRSKDSAFTFRVADTAGIRSTNDEIEKIGIERTNQAALEADLVLFIVDASGSAGQFEGLRESKKTDQAIGVLTKCDLLSETDMQRVEKEIGDSSGLRTWIRTSALTGSGISTVANAMVDRARKWARRKEGEVLLTRLEHREAVNQALHHLERAREAPELELFAADIRHSLHALSELIGETVPDDILGRVFSQFCIGK